MLDLQTKLFIGGKFVDALSGKTYPVPNPNPLCGDDVERLNANKDLYKSFSISVDERKVDIVDVQSASLDDIKAALAAAAAAQPTWESLSSHARAQKIRGLAQLISSQKEELVKILGFHRSNSVRDAEIAASMSILDASANLGDTVFAEEFGSSDFKLRQLVEAREGVANWKHPLLIVLAKIIPMLASGKTVVVKAPFKSPLPALYVARLFLEAGFPPGTINIVSGAWATIGQVFGDASLAATPSVELIDSDVYYPVGQLNPRLQEEGCIGVGFDRKWYNIVGSEGCTSIKRSLALNEWGYNWKGEMVMPLQAMERIKNEVAAINYIKSNTDIPVPNIRCAFEDNGRYYLITDAVRGVAMDKLPEERREIAIKELEGYVEEMRKIKSRNMGGFLGVACLPWRLAVALPREEASTLQFADTEAYEYVLCHNNLVQQNVIVDEETFKISAITDWEYAGFYPKEFEGAFYKRPGPSAASEGEIDDVPLLMDIVKECKK